MLAWLVCLSVRMEQLGSHWTGFDKIWYLTIFRKFVQKRVLYMKTNIQFWYFAHFFLQLEMFQKNL